MCLKKAICKVCSAGANLPIIGGLLKPKSRVSIIRLSGVIADSDTKRRGTLSFHRLAESISDAFDEFDLKAVCLVINSPGGSPAQSALIGDHIRNLAIEKNVPVYAFVEDIAASGGYWLACAADEIYTNETSIVGSIGVISASFGLQDLIARYGVERRVYTSGKDKGFLDPFMEEKPADVKRLKALQKELHISFIDWVKLRRRDKIKAKDSEVFEGQFWSGKTALDMGMIDGFGEARHFCKEKFGDQIKFKEFSPDRGLLSSLISATVKPTFAQDALETIESKSIWTRYGF